MPEDAVYRSSHNTNQKQDRNIIDQGMKKLYKPEAGQKHYRPRLEETVFRPRNSTDQETE